MEQQRYVRKNISMYELQRRQQARQARRRVFYFLLFTIVTVVFLIVCFMIFLNVRSIQITGNEQYSAEAILEALPVKTGDNIYSFRAGAAADQVKSALPLIGEIEIERKLPSTLEIRVVEQGPKLCLTIGNEYYALSERLRVVGRYTSKDLLPEGLIRIETSAVERCIVGEPISFKDARTYDALRDLYAYFKENQVADRLQTIDIRSRFDITVRYDDRFSVYFGDIENIDIKVKFLVGIVSDSHMYPSDRGKIDVSNYHEATFLPE